MRGGRGIRREGLAFAVALVAGLLAARCGDPTTGNCSPGDPNCTCTGGTCQNVCPASRACGTACCGEDQVCSAGRCEGAGPIIGPGQCKYIPGPGEFEAPERAWWWPYTDATGTTRRPIERPEFAQVMSTPVVVKLHGGKDPDEIPAVVFSTFRSGGSQNVEGILRIVRGDTGEDIVSVTDPALRVNGVSSPSAGDLDGDGEVEIVTGLWDPANGREGGVVALRNDGSLLWKRTGINVGWGGASIAELDGKPPAEVVIGNLVLDGATGDVRCDGGTDEPRGTNGVGPLSVVVDIDADDKPEIVTGSMAYKFVVDLLGKATCVKMWPDELFSSSGERLYDGFPAVADIYDDPAVRTTVGRPEIAVVSHGTIRVHDWTGGIVMNPVTLKGGGSGGPPTIADFDGDGKAEIGVASISSYTVFKPGRPRNTLWNVPTQDISSSTTGSSVFDFDGNGRAEVVYADECYVHVYDGQTGTEVFQAKNTSCTAYEMPVIADADGDGAAELLVGANSECSIECPYGSHASLAMVGLQAFKSPTDSWVASRPVWNQHAYHMTNVNDDGSIPLKEARSWGPGTKNSFRQNFQAAGTFDAPNLRVSRVRLDGDQCPSSLTMVAEIENAGSRGVRTGMPVAFYQETSGGRQLLGIARVPQLLRPGQKVEVSLEWLGPPRLNPVTVTVVADDDGTGQFPKGKHNECDESDNTRKIDDLMCRQAG